MISRILKQILLHKFITGIILVFIIGGGYFGFNNIIKDGTAIQYVTAAVEKGTIVTAISGSGILSLADEVNLDFESNGRITNVYVEEGEEVKKGDWLARIDSTELQLQVISAKENLANKEDQLAELLAEIPSAELLSLEIDIEIARLNLEEAKQDYEEFNEPPDQRELDNAKNRMDELEFRYLDIKEDYENMQNGYSQLEIKKAQIAYDKDLASYNKANQDYIDLINNNPAPTQAELEAAQNKVDEKYAAHQEAIAYEALKLAEYNEDPDSSVKQAEYQLAQTQRQSAYTAWQNAINSYNNIRSNPPLDQQEIEDARIRKNELEIKYLEAQDALNKKQAGYTQAELKSAEIAVNEALDNWEDTKQSYDDLVNNKPADALDIAKAQNKVSQMEMDYLEAQEKLEDVKRGPDENSIASLELQVAKARFDLTEAQSKLAGALLVSPINGVVAEISQQVGEKSSGSGGSSFITVVSKEYLVNITLNEADIAKVKLDQLATLTFDAIDGLTLTGKVIEVDSLGTVSQGIVSYGITLSLDTVDERLRQSMTADASIIIDKKIDVVFVPNSAIQAQGNSISVQVLATETEDPSVKIVEVGVSNDEVTEIISGLQEGEKVVTATLGGETQTNVQTANIGASFQIPGLGGNAGGNFRGAGFQGR